MSNILAMVVSHLTVGFRFSGMMVRAGACITTQCVSL